MNTKEKVEAVLEEVRPALQADGGGVHHVSVVAAKPINPSYDQRVAPSQDVEQPAALRSIGKPDLNPRNAVVGEDMVEGEARCFCMVSLVFQRLISGRYPGVENRCHGGPTCP